MLTNRTDLDQTFDINSHNTMAEIRAMRKIKESAAASYALTEFLQHTEAEADKIIYDPVYTDSDMKLIAAISPMLAGDLNLVIDSFYTDEKPTEPASCVEVVNRMVESFPSEPIVLTASNGNYSLYEHGPDISHGLVRRLLRAKKFVQKCESERVAAQEYYHSVSEHEKSLSADSLETAVLVYTPFEIASSAANHLDASSNTFFKYLAMSKQNDNVTALVAISFFGMCALYSLRRPVNCLRQGVASVTGLFKICGKSHQKVVEEEEAPVFSI